MTSQADASLEPNEMPEEQAGPRGGAKEVDSSVAIDEGASNTGVANTPSTTPADSGIKRALNPKLWFAKKNRPGIIAFLLPALIIFIAFQTAGVWPIGDRHILTIDLYHQYAPFLAEYRRKLLSFDTLWYSWNGGLGTDFWSLFAYYLASPINLLIVLFPASQLSSFVLFDVVLKTGLMGYTSYYYLRRGREHTPWTAVLFALGYALSSFTLAYFWNIMWLDVLIMLPVLAYTTTLLVKKERIAPYAISVAVTLVVNYYAAFFALLFTALYFLALLFENVPFKRWKDQIAKATLFGGASVFGAALAGFVVIPVYLKLQHTSASGDSWPENLDFMFSPIDLFGRMMYTSAPAVRDGLPNLYAGVLVLLLLPVYFLAKGISARAKVVNGLLLAFMVLSLSVNSLNFFWHGMHYPNQLSHRFAFVVVFLLSVMAADAFRAYRSERGLLVKSAVGIGILALILYKVDKDALSARSMFLTIVISAIYVAVLTAYARRDEVEWHLGKRVVRASAQTATVFTMLALVAAELLGSSIIGIRDVRDGQVFGSIDGYASGEMPSELRAEIAKIKADNPDTYPRAELTEIKTYNPPFLYGYNGVTMFSSTFAEEQLHLMTNIGMSTNGINSYAYHPAKALDSFLGVRYLLDAEKSRPKVVDYETISEGVGLRVYENPDALPQAFVVEESAKSFASDENGFLSNQAAMYEAAFGKSGLYEPVTAQFESSSGTVEDRGSNEFGQEVSISNGSDDATAIASFTAKKSGHYFMAYKSGSGKVNGIYNYRNTIDDDTYRVTDHKNAVIDLGNLESGETARVQIRTAKDSGGTVSVEFGLLNESVYEAALDAAAQSPVQISRGARSLDLDVNANASGYVLVSSVYDPGWSATVNGEAVEIAPFDSSLMLVPIQAGENHISMTFKPVGMVAGILTSLAALILLVGLAYMEKRDRARAGKRAEKRRIQASHEAGDADAGRDDSGDADAGRGNSSDAEVAEGVATESEAEATEPAPERDEAYRASE